MEENGQWDNRQLQQDIGKREFSRSARHARAKARIKTRYERFFLLLLILTLIAGVSLLFLKGRAAYNTTSPTRKKIEVASKNNMIAAKESTETLAAVDNKRVQRLDADAQANTIVLMGCGDMMFDRQVASMIKSKGMEEPFAGVKDVFQAGDIVAGNLEGPLSTRGQAVEGKEYTFRSSPEVARTMRSAGINLVSLANNHIMDYGPDAFVDTIKALDQNSIYHAGAAANHAEAYSPALLSVKGKKIAFFSYSSVVPPGFWVTGQRPGIASSKTNWPALESYVRKAAAENDFVIASFHWGTELEDTTQASQVQLARRFIDAGADVVIGHHPHVMQGIEIYKGKVIAYSLGNFIFPNRGAKTSETFILKVELADDAISKVEAIPIKITPLGKPQVARGDSASSILKRLKTLSQAFGTGMHILEGRAEVRLK